ncbi:MAG: HDOD domain-containing protein [Acidobacteriota bacterium]
MDQSARLRAAVVAKVDEIPALPTIVPKLLAILQDDDASVSDIAAVISYDPSLTSKILRVANSAYYGFSGQVSELRKAVMLIGLRMVKSLALSIPIVHRLPSGSPSGHFSQMGLWIHSLAVGTLARWLAQQRRDPSAEALFLAGTLHDIGKIVFSEYFGSSFEQTLANVRAGNCRFLFQSERETFGMDHGELASLILKRWEFPAQIIEPIAFHHADEIPPDSDRMSITTLKVANTIVQEMQVGSDGNVTPPMYDLTELRLLELASTDLEQAQTYLADMEEGIQQFYSAIT